MCGRYGFTDPKKIKSRYNTKNELDYFESRFNVPPSSMMPVITNQEEKRVEVMKWGLIPSWAKDLSIGNKMINARAEGIEEKNSFKKPLKFQRCLVPASFFYEWKRIEKEKIPYLIKLKNEDIFSFAGLFDIKKDVEGKEIKTFTIITTNSNEAMAKIHNRMPVILTKDEEKLWLNSDVIEPKEVLPLLKAIPSDLMEIYQVSNSVNSPTNDFIDLTKPVVRNY